MKYTKETIEKIIEGIKKGQGRVASSKNAGINFDTFNEWMKDKRKPEFSEAIKKAEFEFYDKTKTTAIQSIVMAMPNAWQAAAWWLERKYKNEYAARNEMTGADGKKIEGVIVYLPDRDKINKENEKKKIS